MQDVIDIRSKDDYQEDDEMQVVAFKLGNEEYAVDILFVQEIIRLLNITRVPRSGEHIEGVINLRGNIIPIVNLHLNLTCKPLKIRKLSALLYSN